MPRGAAVIRYEGARGVVWRLKYADVDGRQVMETLGPEAAGWTRKKAEAELRDRLVKVERRGWRKPAPLTFAAYAETWFAEGPSRRGWRASTVRQHRSTKSRLVEAFGPVPLAAIRPRHVAAYVADVARRLAPETVGRDVSTLSALFTSAEREELVEANPARRAERPKRTRRRWRILEPVEVQAIARSFPDDERGRLARSAFLTVVTTGIRRHELQALRWRDVDLIENVLRVVKSKSDAGERAIALPPLLAEELWQHRRSSPYRGDDERVFPSTAGGAYRAPEFRKQLRAAITKAKVEGADDLRPFHDLRHASLTLGALAGEGEVALMARAGHRSMDTTRIYLDLAGRVFREEAEQLERALRGPKLSTPLSTHLSAPESTGAD